MAQIDPGHTNTTNFKEEDMKRRILLGLILVIATLGLVWAGGGQEPAPSAAPATPAAPAGPITLRVWGGVPEENGPGDLIAAFEAANPNINVEYTRFVNDDSGNLRLDTALIAGGQVDVYFTYNTQRLPLRVRSGNALALKSLASADNFALESEFGDLSFSSIDGQIFAIPTNIGPQFFMANMDRLQQAGITTIPTEWTAQEFRDIARRLTSGSGQDKQFGVMYPNWPHLSILGAQVALGPNGFLTPDGTQANFSNPLFRQSIELRRAMQYDDKSEVPYVDVVAQNLSDATEYLKGRVAMIYTGTWRLRNINDPAQTPNFKTTFLPVFSMQPNQQRLYNEGSAGDWAMITRDTRHPEAAWQFIKYWATVGSDPMVAKGGKIPAWTSYPSEKVVEVLLGKNPEQRFDVDAFRRVVLEAPLFSYQPTNDVAREIYNDMRNVLKEEVELLFVGRQNLDRTIEQMNSRTNALVRAAQ